MYITITIESGGERHSVKVDDRQKVSSVHAALYEAGLIKSIDAPKLYKSELLSELVRPELTLKEQGVISGDFLTGRI